MKLKKIVSLIAGVVLSVGIFSGNNSFETIANAAQVNVNLIQNGNFDSNLKGWGTFTTEGGAGEVSYEDGAIKAQVDNCGYSQYSIQIYKDGFRMYKNGKYHLEFDVSSTVNRKIKYAIQLNRGDYRSYTEGIVDSTNEVQKVSQDFVMNEENDMTPRLAFDFGNVAGENLEPHSVKIDNVKLVFPDNITKPKATHKITVIIFFNFITHFLSFLFTNSYSIEPLNE